MSKDATSRPDPTLFAEDSLVSHSPKLENSLPKTTPVTSGRKCLDLSGNAGPLGLLEKTLLGSSNWAWTKYSLTWKAKATPQGRLIYQLARLAPRTSDSGSGLLHTPTAKANQTSPSTEPGNWVSGLGGAKPHHMVPTPTTMDHVERKSTNKTPSTGKLNYETNKSVSLDRWAKMWPTPTMWQTPNVEDAGRTGSKEAWIKYQDQGHTPSCRLRNQVQMWPTPTTDIGHERSKEYWEKRAGKHQIDLQGSVKMWPTPTTPTGGGERSGDRSGTGSLNYMARSGQLKMWPTPRAQEAKHGAATEWELQTDHAGTKASLRVQVVKVIEQDDPKITGSLNPQWVAWLMGYPTEYLSCVPWATRSSRKSRKK